MVAEAQAPQQLIRGVRLPAWRRRTWSADLARVVATPHADVVLVPVAVEAAGRRSVDAGTIADALPPIAAARKRGVPISVVLDHAGPAAGLWAKDRPIGPGEVPEPRTGRRPRALEDEEWAALAQQLEAAAAACAAHDVPCILGVDDDGLLHATLSPRSAPALSAARRLELILALHRAVSRGAGRAVDVLLMVEELCPGGIDPTDGIAAATALVAQGARRIFASAGSAVLPSLRYRQKGRTTRGATHVLASAAWLAGRVDVQVLAVVPAWESGIEEQAQRMLVAGVVVEDAGGTRPLDQHQNAASDDGAVTDAIIEVQR